jgi:outer membrane protein TolC
VYNRAEKEKAAGDMEKAGADFAQARDMFDAAYQSARQKREQALKAIQETDEALAQSEQKAVEAQETLDSEGIPVQGEGQ